MTGATDGRGSLYNFCRMLDWIGGPELESDKVNEKDWLDVFSKMDSEELYFKRHYLNSFVQTTSNQTIRRTTGPINTINFLIVSVNLKYRLCGVLGNRSKAELTVFEVAWYFFLDTSTNASIPDQDSRVVGRSQYIWILPIPFDLSCGCWKRERRGAWVMTWLLHWDRWTDIHLQFHAQKPWTAVFRARRRSKV
jgi:hypothetical protein